MGEQDSSEKSESSQVRTFFKIHVHEHDDTYTEWEDEYDTVAQAEQVVQRNILSDFEALQYFRDPQRFPPIMQEESDAAIKRTLGITYVIVSVTEKHVKSYNVRKLDAARK